MEYFKFEQWYSGWHTGGYRPIKALGKQPRTIHLDMQVTYVVAGVEAEQVCTAAQFRMLIGAGAAMTQAQVDAFIESERQAKIAGYDLHKGVFV